MPVAVRAAKIAFWASTGLLVYAHVGYAGVLAALARRRAGAAEAGDAASPGDPPTVSVIVAAYAEQEVIAERVANLRRLDYPADRVQVIVACDGSPDETADRARAAGADPCSSCPGPARSALRTPPWSAREAEIVAFSDANVSWEPDALTRLVAPFRDPEVGYVCGDVRFVNEQRRQPGGPVLALRDGAAVARVPGAVGDRRQRRDLRDAARGPTSSSTRSWATTCRSRSTWSSAAGGPSTRPAPTPREKMVPTIEGEFDRKRRMMSHGWPIMLTGGMLSPRGYDPVYALMIVSHRVLRYASPFLHAAALAANVTLLRPGRVYRLALVAQLGAASRPRWRRR